MIYGEQYRAGLAVTTVLASMDFETYSEAGYVWHPTPRKWRSLKKNRPGIKGVGAWKYAEHPSAEVLCLAYDLKDGRGRHLWRPGDPPPLDLFAHIARGGLVEAVNSFFEFAVWTNICAARMGWPPLPLEQIRDVAAKAGAATYPRALEAACKALRTPVRKDTAGATVMRKVTKPRSPTKKDDRQRYTPADAPEDFATLYAYCVGDIAAEDEVSLRCADLSPQEQEIQLADQRINARGVYCNRAAVLASRKIIAQAVIRYHAELAAITGGIVQTADELDAIKAWMLTRGVPTPDGLTKDSIPELLEIPHLPPDVRRVLEIRTVMGSKSVTKTAAMLYEMSDRDDRIRGLYTYAGACRTWRWAGNGAQPQNLPSTGPEVIRCKGCNTVRWEGLPVCLSCFSSESGPAEWGIDAAQACITTILHGDLDLVETLWGDALTAIAGCLRSFLLAAPGNEFISADLNSIEAVVLAELAGETWRQEVFRTHGKIYEMSAAKMSGVPFEEYLRYREETGMHHPDRKRGKVAELASGYGGWVESWKNFGADKWMTDAECERDVIAWRKANPMIIKFWAGLEAAAMNAIRNPGVEYAFRGHVYLVHQETLYCRLVSGRCIPYHQPRVSEELWFGKMKDQISYMGLNPQKNWARLWTRGPKLCADVTQATARDIFAPSLVRLELAGYPVVLHTHDEAVAEVVAGTGSVEEVEAILSQGEPWCAGWPIRATGGWRGREYRKD